MKINNGSKYNLATAMTLVIGTVIGSGIFFKAERILAITNYSVTRGISAWLAGGLVMLFCAVAFSVLALKYPDADGLTGFATQTVGPSYGYYTGWFMATIYYPTMTSVLAWLSSRYLCILMGFDETGAEALLFSGLFLTAIFVMNVLAPVIAGYFQISTTVIKLLPLFAVALIGISAGIKNGVLFGDRTYINPVDANGNNSFFAAVVSSAFAYEGWIAATSIQRELKNSHRNLPIALTGGSIFVILIYILYYIGYAGFMPGTILLNRGGSILYVFIFISCLGTLNGLTMASSRAFYSIARHKKGPVPDMLSSMDPYSKSPMNSAAVSLLVCFIWLVYFYGANLVTEPWFGYFSFDSSELPVITTYAIYIPIFISMLRNKELKTTGSRYVIPCAAILASVFMMYCAYIAHKGDIPFYLIIFIVVLVIGAVLNKLNRISK